MKSFPQRFRAFTLIELLVVIGIIAILVSLTLAGMRGTRGKAEAVRCVANLRQIGAGLALFAGDNGGNFPLAGSTVEWGQIDSTTQQPSWTEQLCAYLGTTNSNLFRCTTGARKLAANKNFSYFLGARAAHSDAGGFAALQLQRVPRPAKMILGGDSTYPGFTAGDADKDDYSVGAPFASPGPHNGKSNLLFVDGSVRAYAGFEIGEMEVNYTNTNATY